MLSIIASQLVHSENESCLLRTSVMAVFSFEVTVSAILGDDELKLKGNFISNQNVTDEINSISENPTKIKVL